MASSRAGIALIATTFGLFIGMGVTQMRSPKAIEAETILLKRPGGGSIELSVEAAPTIKMTNSSGQITQEMAIGANGESLLTLHDHEGRGRIQMQGGGQPAIYLKSESGEIIGAMLTLQDGGAAVGLADRDGDVAALVRGGGSPSVSLFQKSAEPHVAMGVNQNVPHLLVTSKKNQDSLVIHGGDTTSLLFVDKQGDVSVFLSKYGLYQDNSEKEKKQDNASKDSKIFTWRDLGFSFDGKKLGGFDKAHEDACASQDN